MYVLLISFLYVDTLMTRCYVINTFCHKHNSVMYLQELLLNLRIVNYLISNIYIYILILKL